MPATDDQTGDKYAVPRRKSFAVPLGMVVKCKVVEGEIVIAIRQWGGIGGTEQRGATMACQVERQVGLLPEMPSVSANDNGAKLCGYIVV